MMYSLVANNENNDSHEKHLAKLLKYWHEVIASRNVREQKKSANGSQRYDITIWPAIDVID